MFVSLNSVLGMNLFGGKFCWKEDGSSCTCKESMDPSLCECDRANFNSLLWALVTVFQVISLRTVPFPISFFTLFWCHRVMLCFHSWQTLNDPCTLKNCLRYSVFSLCIQLKHWIKWFVINYLFENIADLIAQIPLYVAPTKVCLHHSVLWWRHNHFTMTAQWLQPLIIPASRYQTRCWRNFNTSHRSMDILYTLA